MRPYETMYILRPDLGDGEIESAIAKYQTFLQDQGSESIKVQHRGKRRLAYEIDRHREGVYVQMNYYAKPSTIELLERSMRLSDDVIRYMTLAREAEDRVAVGAGNEVESETAAS
ncbi:30S ribosomal protein S6 [Pseudanabaena sp. PCC 6802]|uniref:30S ribosomal protein S6 n=1 Tax=Pseudanabaena sp. PCC 6802 TaxID=118173 RepID=UPI0003477620|nr:30S ribosomal protein S6 [Pseudanabaena sp. PCC 6802]